MPALFAIGFAGYPVIELLWRRRTHWSMALTGGLCCALLCRLFYRLRRRAMLTKCIVGSFIITCIEYSVGYFVNIKLGLGVWDYSALPLNYRGQVCARYSLLWAGLCVPLCALSRVAFPNDAADVRTKNTAPLNETVFLNRRSLRRWCG